MEIRNDPFRPASQESEAEVRVQQQRVTSTCAICGESIEALVADAVAWFAHHRKTKHPNQPARTPAQT